MRRAGIWAVALVVGALVGGVVRRARAGAAPAPIEAAGPTAERVEAARARAEIRGLDRTLAALREETDRLDRERLRLQAAEAVPAAFVPLEAVRRELRKSLESGRYTIFGDLGPWLDRDPSNVAAVLRVGADVLRERDWGPRAAASLGETLRMMISSVVQGEKRAALGAWLAGAQATERDPLVRGWMLSFLYAWKVALPPEAAAALARDMDGMADPALRAAAFAALARSPQGHEDALREALRRAGPEERATALLQAWQVKALPAAELRAGIRDGMRSSDPGALILAAESWVPKYVNPFAPQETVALFQQTLSKPIPGYQKAVSMMVMGSLSTVFPGRPGRAELEAFARSTADEPLKAFAGKLVEMIDQGRSFDEIRRLDPAEFGIAPP